MWFWGCLFWGFYKFYYKVNIYDIWKIIGDSKWLNDKLNDFNNICLKNLEKRNLMCIILGGLYLSKFLLRKRNLNLMWVSWVYRKKGRVAILGFRNEYLKKIMGGLE